MKVSTAKLVDLYVYRDYGMALEEDVIVRAKLIQDWPYAFRAAAGYIRMMEDRGINGHFEQFMSYSLSLDLASRWKDARYSMGVATLTRIGASPDVLVERRAHYLNAKAAIG